jgi:O-antigen/teichoic acid export membrane protein
MNLRMNTSRLLTGSAILFLGTILLSVGNYLFNVCMARMLGPDDYGIFMSLLSMMYLVLIPIGAVLTIAMKYSAGFSTRQEYDTLFAFNYVFGKKLLLLGVIVAIIFNILSFPLKSYLHMDSLVPFFIVSLLFVLYFVVSLQRGIMRGMGRNGHFVLSQVLEVVLKVIVGVGFVMFGFNVSGALGGFVAGIFGALLVSLVQIPYKKYTRNKESKFTFDAKFKRYFLVVFVGLLSLTVFHTLDVIMIKHYLPDVAGHYSALSLLGKGIYFACMAVIGVMFPLIASKNVKQESHLKELKEAFFLVTIIAVSGIAVFHLFPEQIVYIMFGKSYVDIVPFVSSYSVFIVLISLNSLFIHYFLSIGYTTFIYYLVPFAVLQILAVMIFHTSVAGILEGLIVINFVLLLATLTNYYRLTKLNYE